MDANLQLTRLRKEGLRARNTVTGGTWYPTTVTSYGVTPAHSPIRFGSTYVDVYWQSSQFACGIRKYDTSTNVGSAQAHAYVSGIAPTEQQSTSVVKLADGRLLVTGGGTGAGVRVTKSWLITYDTSTDTASGVTSTDIPLGGYSSNGCLLPDGRVFVLSGWGSSGANDQAYIGSVSGTTISWSAAITIPSGAYSASGNNPRCMVLSDGRILLVGVGDTPYTGSDQQYIKIGTVSGSTVSWVDATVNNSPLLPYDSIGSILPMYGDEFAVFARQAGRHPDAILWRGKVVGDTVSFTALARPAHAFLTFPFGLGTQASNGTLVFVDSTLVRGFAIDGYVDPMQIDASLTCSASVVADMSVPIPLVANLVAFPYVYAELIPPINLLSDLYSQAAISAKLNGDFYASLSAAQSILADLTDYVPPTAYLAAQLKAQSDVLARLSTGVGFSASLSCATTTASSLLSQIRIAANLSAQVSLTADIATQIRLAAALDQLSTLVTELTTQITMESDISAAASCRAYLIVPIPEEMQQCYVLTPEHAEVCYGI